MVIHFPKNLREITSFKKSSTGPNKQHTSYSVTGIDADLDDIDEYNILSYGVSVSIDDEGTEMRRRKSDKEFEDSPWWEKEPINLNIFLQLFIENNITKTMQTTRYTEVPAERLSPEDYRGLIQEGVDSMVSDLDSN